MAAAAGSASSAAAEVASNEDLLEEILLRLPHPPSLLLAALVCRAWLRVVRRICPRSPAAIGYFFVSVTWHSYTATPTEAFFLDSDCSPSRFSRALTRYAGHRDVVDSRDGLLLLSSDASGAERRFSVHNPLAGAAALGFPFPPPVHPFCTSSWDYHHTHARDIAVRRGNGCAFEVLFLGSKDMTAHIFLYSPKLTEGWSLVLSHKTVSGASVTSFHDSEIRMLASRRRLFLLCAHMRRKWMVMLNIHTLQVLGTVLLPPNVYGRTYFSKWNLLVLDDGYEVSGEDENEVDIVILDDRKLVLRFFSRSCDGVKFLFKKMIALPENIKRDKRRRYTLLYANHRMVVLRSFNAVYQLNLDSMEAEMVHDGCHSNFYRFCPYTSPMIL